MTRLTLRIVHAAELGVLALVFVVTDGAGQFPAPPSAVCGGLEGKGGSGNPGQRRATSRVKAVRVEGGPATTRRWASARAAAETP